MLEDQKKRNKILGRIKNLETDNERLKLRTQLHNQNEFEQKIIKGINFSNNNHVKEIKDSDKFLNAAFIFKRKI